MKSICSLITRAALLALVSSLDLQLSTALAQGTAFTYQGRLNDNASPANGAYDLTFTLFNASSGGAVLGATNVFDDLLVSNGLFTVTLDYGAQFDGNARWLQIGVRPGASAGAYTNVTPRQAITSTPYAIRALNFSGTIASAQLSGSYGSAVTFNNAGNSFTGNGAGLTALDANQLASGTVPLARLSGITSNQLDAATWQLATNANGGPIAPGTWTVGGNNVTPGQFLGSTNNQPLEFKVNGLRALRLEPATNVTDNGLNFFTNTAPNLIGGSVANFVAPGKIGAVIAGGGTTNYYGFPATNSVSGDFGTIGGGLNNVVQAFESTIGGGGQNRIESTDVEINDFGKTISGGERNKIQTGASYTTIGGGFQNEIYTNAYDATIGGGHGNTIQTLGFSSTIGGGFGNTIQTNSGYSTIGGGIQNVVSGLAGTVPGGNNNLAGQLSLAAGRRAKASHAGSFVWADSTDADFGTTASDQFLIRATAGVGIGTSLPHHRLRVSGGPTWTTAGWAGALELDYGAAIGWNGAGGGWRFGIGQTGGGLYFFQTASDPGSAATAPIYDMVITDAGRVGIGTTIPTFQLQLSTDSAGKPNGGSWGNTSDARVKKNIKPLSGALDKLTQLRGVSFEWVNPEDHANQHGPQGGFIAQEIERVFPHWITPVAAAGRDQALSEDGKIKSLTLPFEFDALLVEAIKEQQKQIKARDAEIRELKQRLDRIEKLMNRMTLSQAGSAK